MRRYFAVLLLCLMLAQSSGVATAAATTTSTGRYTPSLLTELTMTIQPALTSFEASQAFAMLTGSENRYALMHQPKPRFDRTLLARAAQSPRTESSRARNVRAIERYGSPLTMRLQSFANPLKVSADPLLAHARQRVVARTLSPGLPRSHGGPTPKPGLTIAGR